MADSSVSAQVDALTRLCEEMKREAKRIPPDPVKLTALAAKIRLTAVALAANSNNSGENA